MRFFRRVVDGATLYAYTKLLTQAFNSAPWMTRGTRSCKVERINAKRTVNGDWIMVIYVNTAATWTKIGPYDVYSDIDFNHFDFGREIQLNEVDA